MVLWHLDRSHQLLNSHQTFIIFSHQQWADTQSHQNEMSLLLCSFQNTIWCQQKNTSKWFTGFKKTSEKLNSGRIIYCTWNQTSAFCLPRRSHYLFSASFLCLVPCFSSLFRLKAFWSRQCFKWISKKPESNPPAVKFLSGGTVLKQCQM